MRVKKSASGVLVSVVSAVVAIGFAVPAMAETLLIDFGSNSSFRGVSVPAPDANGHYWNSLSPGAFYSGMRDINNTATTVALGFDTPVGTDSYNGPAGATSFPNPTAAEIASTDIDTVALGDLGVKEAAIDFAASAGLGDNRCRFQIQGLDPTETYTLKIFGSHRFGTDDATVYSIFTDSSYSTLVATQSLNVQIPGSPFLNNRDTVATFTDIAPQASNILYVQFVGSAGGLGYLNDFELIGAPAIVPEPGNLLPAGVGALALARRRRF